VDVCFVSDRWGRLQYTGIGIYEDRVLEHVRALEPDATYTALGMREAVPPRNPPDAHLHYAHASVPAKLTYLRWLTLGAEADVARSAPTTDLVHTLSVYPSWTTRRPWVVTAHDISPVLFPDQYPPRQRRKFELTMKAAVRHGAHFIAISQHTADDLQRVYGLPASRVSVVYFGIDAEKVTLTDAEQGEIRSRLGLPRRFFVYLGNLNRRKNLVTLVRAFASIADRIPDVDLVLAGKEELGTEELRASVASSGVPGRIHLPGFLDRSDAIGLLAMAEAFVFPSLYEGFGLPPLEAMVQGTPAVVAAGGSVPEVVGDAALISDPLDVDALASHLVQVVTEPALRAELIERGYARSSEFTWARMARETRAVYETLV
jgi:glycosyltransferase involved in cell wall biosynthesis